MFYEKKVFSEIKPNENEILSRLNKCDLEYLLSLINNYKLLLRDKIGVSETETFGLEIECESADWNKISYMLDVDWELTDDLSLIDGAEIKSPILRDTKDNWLQLKSVCSVLSRYAEVGINAGGHVHIGKQALGNEKKSLINFMKLWAMYEHIIFRFSYGEFLGPRPGFKDASKSVCPDFLNLCYWDEMMGMNKREMLKSLSGDKCNAVNFRHYNTFGTLEFRCPNASLNPVIWQNNVNLFVKMLLYSKSKNFDEGKIDEKRYNLFYVDKSPLEIYVNDAIEFADLIFDNNMDKVYFLRQYLKSFEKSNEYVFAKRFS